VTAVGSRKHARSAARSITVAGWRECGSAGGSDLPGRSGRMPLALRLRLRRPAARGRCCSTRIVPRIFWRAYIRAHVAQAERDAGGSNRAHAVPPPAPSAPCAPASPSAVPQCAGGADSHPAGELPAPVATEHTQPSAAVERALRGAQHASGAALLHEIARGSRRRIATEPCISSAAAVANSRERLPTPKAKRTASTRNYGDRNRLIVNRSTGTPSSNSMSTISNALEMTKYLSFM
jgi:hypothetical protein